MKAFFEDPALLIGLPFLILGIAGALLVAAMLVSYWVKPS